MKIRNTYLKARKTTKNKKDTPKHIFSFIKISILVFDFKQPKSKI